MLFDVHAPSGSQTPKNKKVNVRVITKEEQKKKRSKKEVVDENQLSIFDFVA